MKKVIVVAPHPDDELIGCGGTLLKHVSNGDRVYVLYFTNGEFYIDNEKEYMNKCNIRKREAEEVCESANFNLLFWSDVPARHIRENYSAILKRVVKIFHYIKPEYIYMPHHGEKDIDHVISHEITKEAYWLSKCTVENGKQNCVLASLRNYEVWTPHKEVHLCCDISSTIKLKTELINLYFSQVCNINYAKASAGLNQYRSAIYGVGKYAEAFTLEKG